MPRTIYILGQVVLVATLGGFARLDASGPTPSEAFDRFAADYLEAYLAAHPVRATKLGTHEHDSKLPDLSRGALRRRVAELRRRLAELERHDPAALDPQQAYDHRILDHAIRAELLELEEVRGWQRNPMLYNTVLANGVAFLVDREFSTLDARLNSLIARLEQFPRIISAAKKNLADVPATWAELALKNTRGNVAFLSQSVPAALWDQGLGRLDPDLILKWDRVHRRAVRKLEGFARWMEEELGPRAQGDYRLGPDVFERKLRYEEHVSLSVEELNRLNEEAIERYREWVAREAERLDPERTAAEVMASVTGNYPSPDELLPTARRNVEDARRFVIDRRIVTLPPGEPPIIRPTPEYARSGFASMSTPGPFETEATESYYNITNVDPDWTSEQQAQHLTYFNYPGLIGVSVHEVMPGHYVQMLYQRELPTDVRKVFAPASLVEGWAHYTEQMMIDEGFGGGDPAIRLGQLRRALQRHARWYAGLALHAGDTSLEQAAERFAEIAYFAPFPALRETRRGTYNPTYLYYALGRMQILELREDYRRYRESRGEPFSLMEFHDRFLRLGLPVSLARRAMIPDDADDVAAGGGDPELRRLD